MNTDPHQHFVTVQGAARLALGEINVITALVGTHKSKAIAMGQDPPGDEIHAAGEAETLGAGLDELAIAGHGQQATFKRGLLSLTGETEVCGKLIETAGRGELFERLHDGDPRRQVFDVLMDGFALAGGT